MPGADPREQRGSDEPRPTRGELTLAAARGYPRGSPPYRGPQRTAAPVARPLHRASRLHRAARRRRPRHHRAPLRLRADDRAAARALYRTGAGRGALGPATTSTATNGSQVYKSLERTLDDAVLMTLSARKAEIIEAADQLAPMRRKWRERNAFFHEEESVICAS